jgi:glycerol-3-phosphate O-acyltransferase
MSFEKVRKVYKAIIDLFNEEFIYPEVIIEGDGGIEAMVEYLVARGIILRTNGKISIVGDGEEELRFYAYMVHDYFESYYVVFDTINNLEREKINRKDLMADIRKNGVRHYHLGKIRLMESLSISNYNNALVSMAYSGIIKERTAGKKNIEVTIADRKKAAEIMENIRQYIERS